MFRVFCVHCLQHLLIGQTSDLHRVYGEQQKMLRAIEKKLRGFRKNLGAFLRILPSFLPSSIALMKAMKAKNSFL